MSNLGDSSREPRNSSPQPLQFSLGTLLLLMTLIAACLATTVALPPAGIAVSLIGGIALVRTIAAGRARLQRGRPLDTIEKLRQFFFSVGYALGALLIYVSAFVACAAFAMLLVRLDLLLDGVPTIVQMIGMAALSLCLVLVPFAVLLKFLRHTWPR